MTKIRMDTNWRPDNRTLLHPGIYRVPEDMSLELAERAVRENGAVILDEPPPQVKTPAPENKLKPHGSISNKTTRS